MDLGLFFPVPQNVRVKEHGEKCSGAGSKADKRKYFFTQHIITLWNVLPQDVMEAKSINEFKKKGLDKFMQPPAQEVSQLLITGSREGMPEEGSLYTLPLPISLPKHLQLATARHWLLPKVHVYSEPAWQCLYPPGGSLWMGP